MNQKTMMLVMSHPDDESFPCALTVSRYVKNGWNIHLMCLTNGQAGETGPYGEVSPENLGEIRKEELRKAAEVLGISGITFGGYYDGKLKSVIPGELEDLIYRKMLELAPRIIITYNTTGISNHPDHIKTCYATTFAYQKYASEINESRQFIEDINNHEKKVAKRHFIKKHQVALRKQSFVDVVDSQGVPKLYYACIPESIADYLRKKEVIPEMSFGKRMSGAPDDMITTVIDGKQFVSKKKKALMCHKSQSHDVERFYKISNNPLAGKEFFILRMWGDTEVFMGKNDSVSDRL